MNDAPQTTSEASPRPQFRPIVDFDKGEDFGAQNFVLQYPFRLKGVDYLSITLRVPCAEDVDRCVLPNGNVSPRDLLVILSGAPAIAIDKMQAGDRARLDGWVGKLVVAGPTSSTSSATSAASSASA